MERNMMNNILIWNINQRANYEGAFYPQLVLNCLEKEYDIIIFNEFYKHDNWENVFSNEKYLFETSDNGDKQNEIMIAYNKNKYLKIGDKYTWQSNYDKDFPDYLDIYLKDVYGNSFMVVGTRILVNNYDYHNPTSVNEEMKARARQGDKIACRIKELNDQKYTIIGGGDLNTGRRNNKNEYWNKLIFEQKMPKELKVVIPDGVSHEAYKGNNFAGCPDLLFYSKKLNINLNPFNWNFVNDCNDVYVTGKYTKKIPVPYPDHAQVIANFNFNKK